MIRTWQQDGKRAEGAVGPEPRSHARAQATEEENGVAMDTKKVVSVVAVVFVLFFILKNPDDSASIVHSIGHGLSDGFNQFSEFIKKL